MVENKILARVRRGEKALGLSMKPASEALVELAGRWGLDFVSFDGQHDPLTPAFVERLCRVADGFGITPMMRIPDHRESTILSYLDRGIKAITVPNVQTGEQAEALVKYAYYAPQGLRSATGLRVILNAGSHDLPYLYRVTNENTMVIPQLESATALENVDDILQVKGIDYFAWGPQDLAQSMALPGQPQHPQVLEAMAEAEAKIRAAGKGLFQDITRSVDLLSTVIGAMESLLKDHGRTPNLSW